MSHISALQFRVSSPQTYKSKHLFGNFMLQHKLVHKLFQCTAVKEKGVLSILDLFLES